MLVVVVLVVVVVVVVVVVGGWWLVVGGWWLVVGGWWWWLVVGCWWLVVVGVGVEGASRNTTHVSTPPPRHERLSRFNPPPPTPSLPLETRGVGFKSMGSNTPSYLPAGYALSFRPGVTCPR